MVMGLARIIEPLHAFCNTVVSERGKSGAYPRTRMVLSRDTRRNDGGVLRLLGAFLGLGGAFYTVGIGVSRSRCALYGHIIRDGLVNGVYDRAHSDIPWS